MRKVPGGPAPIGDGRDPAVAVVGVGVGFALGVGGAITSRTQQSHNPWI